MANFKFLHDNFSANQNISLKIDRQIHLNTNVICCYISTLSWIGLLISNFVEVYLQIRPNRLLIWPRGYLCPDVGYFKDRPEIVITPPFREASANFSVDHAVNYIFCRGIHALSYYTMTYFSTFQLFLLHGDLRQTKQCGWVLINIFYAPTRV